MRILYLGLFLLFVRPTLADVVSCKDKVSFAKEISLQISGHAQVDLLLNGVGLRKMFFVSVFYGGLYLENPSQNGDGIIASSETKAMTLELLRNIPRKRLVDEWDREYQRLCGTQCNKLRHFHEKFTSYARDFKKGERMTVVFLKDRVDFITGTDEVYDPIPSGAYGKIMLRSSIGREPASQGFKKGALGLKQECR